MKKVLLALALVFSLTLVGCSDKTEEEKFAEAYELDSPNHVFIKIDEEEVVSFVEEDQKAIVYFGSPV
jgi:uncharacterized lipoprotein NlpE involved in copper resistance